MKEDRKDERDKERRWRVLICALGWVGEGRAYGDVFRFWSIATLTLNAN
jgi:hypothetical protein